MHCTCVQCAHTYADFELSNKYISLLKKVLKGDINLTNAPKHKEYFIRAYQCCIDNDTAGLTPEDAIYKDFESIFKSFDSFNGILPSALPTKSFVSHLFLSKLSDWSFNANNMIHALIGIAFGYLIKYGNSDETHICTVISIFLEIFNPRRTYHYECDEHDSIYKHEQWLSKYFPTRLDSIKKIV